MEHSIEFLGDDGPPDVIVRTSGLGRLSGFTAYLDELLADPRFGPGMSVLVDHSELDASGLVSADARTFATVVTDLADRVRGTALACVVPSGVMYGISRAFEEYSKSSGVRARVFGTAEEALAWLADAKGEPR